MNKHRAWTLIVALAAAASLGLPGCEKGDQQSSSTPSPATPGQPRQEQPAPATDNVPTPAPEAVRTAPSGAAAPVASSGPGVRLIDPGAEPRRELRYNLVKGATETLVMTMDTAIQTKVPGMDMPPARMPTMTMTMDLEILELLSPLEARYQFVLSDARVVPDPKTPPQLVEATQKALDSVKGVKGTALVDSRGMNREANVSLPKSMDPQMTQIMQGTLQSMDQISSPLPREPVGKGATWELHQQIAQNGMTLDQVVRYELIELDGNKGRMRATITQKAGQQMVNVPGANGATAELLELQGEGRGEIAFDLDKLVPRSSLAISSDYAMKVDAMGSSQTVSVHLDMRLSVDKKK